MIKTNEYQTQLTDELLNSLKEEVRTDLLDILNNVEFVRRLISPERKYAKDLDRDSKGRIIVDISNPHIIENMEYFTPAARHFQKHGCYTKLMPNPNPQSEYGQWLRREVLRCWNGMVRESDGEWITGDMYFYLNYFPIIQTKMIEGTNIGDRVTDFPEVWEGVYWRFHYWHQARYGGIYDDFKGGKHCVEIASRGKAHPYSQDVLTPTGFKKWSSINIGDKLYGDDGNITTVIDIPFDDEIDVYKITLKDGREVYSSKNHLWNVHKHGWKDDRIETKSLKDIISDYKRPRKITERNPNGLEYVYSIPSNKGVDFDKKDVFIDPYTMGLLLGDGTFRHPEYLNTVAFTAHKDDMEVYRKYIPYTVNASRTKFGHSIAINGVSEYLKSVGLFMQKSEGKFIPDEYKYNSREVRLELLRGLMDTDGGLSNGRPTYSSVSERLIKDVAFIARSLGYNCNYTKQKAGYKKDGIYKPCLDCYCLWIYTNDKIFKLPRKLNLIPEYTSEYSKSKRDKTRIVNIEFSHIEKSKCVTVDNDSHSYLIGDFIQTHNSKSYSFGSKLVKNFVVGENATTKSKVRSLIAAYQKEYLIKDGTLNKFIDGITHCAKHTQFPSRRLKQSMSDLNWRAGFLDQDTGLEMGTLNEVLGVAIKDDSDKLRGKRPLAYSCNVITPNGYKKWSDIKIGDVLFSDTGELTNVTDLIEVGEQDIYKITLKDGRTTYCTKEHPWEIMYRSAGKTKIKLMRTEELINNTVFTARKYSLYKFNIRNNECVKFDSRELNLDPYVMGLFLGDGCYNKGVNQINLTMTLSDMEDIEKHIPYPVRKSIGRKITHMIDPGSRARTIFDNYGLCKLKSHNKFIPKDYLYNTEENRIKLLNGLLDSDGTCSVDCSVIEYSTKSPLLKDDFIFLCRSLGFGCKATPRVINGETYFRCYLYSNDNRLFNLKRKKDRLKTKSRDAYNNKTAIVSVEFSHREKAKCVTVDSPTHLHLIDDFIITHNSSWMGFEEFGAFPKFLDLWQTSMPNVQDGSAIFGQASAVGTGGSEGADFQGAIEMLNYPDGYNVYSLPNIYDKGATGNKKTIFFFPGYINLKGYYNKDGVSDVIGALIYEIEFRINLKYNSSDPLQLTRRKAETAFTIQDAIMKRDGSLYPTDKLNDVINEINLNPKYTDDMWIGRLSLSKNGEVEYKPDNDLKYITEFPHKDNKITGAICIKQMPIKNSSGSVPWGRYISGIDTFDDDGSDTLSLFSMFILDLWTDELVFEYTGREMFADDSYEIARLALLMYNAECNYENNKKGLFKYFSQHNCLYLLSDTLEFLKDKEIVKGGMYGNKSKGVGNYGAVGGYARRAIRDYLLRSKESIVLNDVDGQIVEQSISVFNYQKIWSKGLLQELAMWNADGNYDRHDALAMLMLLREDKLRLLGDTSPRDAGQNRDVGYLGKDSFFEKNYRKNDLNSTRSKLKFQ